MKSSHLVTHVLILFYGRLRRADLTFCPFIHDLPATIHNHMSKIHLWNNSSWCFKKGCSTNLNDLQQEKTCVSTISQQKVLIHRAKSTLPEISMCPVKMGYPKRIAKYSNHHLQRPQSLPMPPMADACFIDITSHDNKPSVRQSCRWVSLAAEPFFCLI